MTFTSRFLQTCHERALFNQCTDTEGLDKLLSSGKAVPGYIGFDCTAPSLHVGSLIQIMLLRRWQQAGHKPVILMGGGTTKVGDPTGKDKSRVALSDADIAHNMAGIKTVFEKFVTFGDGPTDAIMVNNDDWLSGLKYLEFLRDFGRHFSINRMLTMDSVKLRLEREQPLSFLEFNYMILQGYDFYHLSQNMDVRVQFGGSDQWGNMVGGTELNRRILAEKGGRTEELYAMTTPLFTNSAGAKMGKTADGAIWLNADMLSPYDYWQFWRNSEDAMVGKYLRWFTDLPLSEIERLESLKGAEINEAKKVLATEATRLLHGNEAASQAAETAQKTFELGLTGDSLPEITVSSEELSAGIAITDLLTRAELATSKGEAKKLIQGGGAKLNDEKIADIGLTVTSAHLNVEGIMKLSAGKKRHALVKLS